ncbi:MAG: acetyl ornithine aminotransferase family protein [Planctomycetaceae bacterium]
MSHTAFPPAAPVLKTGLPGPIAQRLIDDDERYTSPSYTRVYPLVVQRGEGAVLEDVDGNLFLDFNAGIGVCATGHAHPQVVAAIQSQAARFLHMSGTDFYYEAQGRLAEKLASLAPGESAKRVLFTNSGTESVEAAIKLARYHTGRQQIIAFYGAFHGRSLGSLTLTSSKTIQRRGFAPLLPGVTHVPFPNPYRCGANRSPEEQAMDCLDHLEQVVLRRTVSPDEVAAVFVEPIQGEGGYIVPPDGFHQRLKSLAEKHGILYVADEVQTGMGRTGKMFAVDHWGVEPDIICLAKGLASGMPLGAIVAKAEVMNWPPGSHASTFGGNPVCCVAALETIALLEDELIDRAAATGEFLRDRLTSLQPRHAMIGDIRGKGLMIGVELVKDLDTQKPAATERNEVVQACFRRGLLILGCGENTIRLSPPLVITEEQAETAVRILDEALAEVHP